MIFNRNAAVARAEAATGIGDYVPGYIKNIGSEELNVFFAIMGSDKIMTIQQPPGIPMTAHQEPINPGSGDLAGEPTLELPTTNVSVRLLDQVAQEMLVTKGFGNDRPVPGGIIRSAILQYDTPPGQMLKPGSYVLAVDPQSKQGFVTGWVNQESGELFIHHYLKSFSDAVFDFWQRINRYERTRPSSKGVAKETLHPGAMLARMVLTAQDETPDPKFSPVNR